jgi:hypothetical protein
MPAARARGRAAGPAPSCCCSGGRLCRFARGRSSSATAVPSKTPQGFSSNLYQYYASQPATATTTDQFGVSHTSITTPKVLAEARSQLGCASLAAVPLEGQGGGGTAGSHWEFRLFQVSRLSCLRP